MKIATWNVNSIRTRLEIVTNWLRQNPIDVLCLQETKVVDELFPKEAIASLGYHVYVSGEKAYNGVAIVSKQPLEDVNIGFGGILTAEIVGDLDDRKRLISGKIDGIRIVNVYVPNGNSVGSDKYHYKMEWLEMLRQYLTAVLTLDRSICICGDFNIALEDRDIYTQKKSDHIMASNSEREALKRATIELGLSDGFRKFTEEGGHYSWWDYRQKGFDLDRGWRIDHLYVTPDLLDRSIDCRIDIEPRRLTQPSDHAPAILELNPHLPPSPTSRV
jgi:exodeoxyribonuclease III